MPKEIELGNGYGYFCNIHDIESQKPVVEQLYTNNYRKYLEEMERRERPSTEFNDALCSCALFSFIMTICFFML